MQMEPAASTVYRQTATSIRSLRCGLGKTLRGNHQGHGSPEQREQSNADTALPMYVLRLPTAAVAAAVEFPDSGRQLQSAGRGHYLYCWLTVPQTGFVAAGLQCCWIDRCRRLMLCISRLMTPSPSSSDLQYLTRKNIWNTKSSPANHQQKTC